MRASIIDGRALARTFRANLVARVRALDAKGVCPSLAVLQVGDHPASKVYVRNKIRACAEVGIGSTHVELPETTEEEDLRNRILALNADERTHGILVQLPLPPSLSATRVQQSVAPGKDVDGFHPINAGLLAIGGLGFVPCTPLGVMRMLEHEGVPIAGRHAVVIGRSNIVGKPVALLLLQQGATVTVCNSRTPDLGSVTRSADILVVAAGSPGLVTSAMVKPGAVVIDVGINRLPSGSLVGDVRFEEVSRIASRITPVPGGVGPMTIAMLLENTVLAAERLAGEGQHPQS